MTASLRGDDLCRWQQRTVSTATATPAAPSVATSCRGAAAGTRRSR